MCKALELVYDRKTGTWGEKKEPFAKIEFETEEDFDFLNERVEKQIAKKPKIFHGSVLTLYPCPICGAKVKSCNYCPQCGQKLDWSEVTE